MRPFVKVLVTLATAGYPLLVYLGFGRWDPIWLALGLAALMFLRAFGGRDPFWVAAGVGVLLLGGATALQGSWLPLKLYPVLVSLVLFVVFALSLVRPPTVVERIARMAEPDLDAAGVAYTRKVTLAWCGFFVVNGSVSAATSLWGSEQAWVLYNGLLSYLLVALFFGGEWLVRRRVRGRAAAAVSHG